MNKLQVTSYIVILLLVSALTFTSCDDSVLNSTEELPSQQNVISKKAPLSEQALPEFTGFKDREYYTQLEDLAYVLATQQHEYSRDMRLSMKKSRVKEGILNLTKGDKIDKNNDLILKVKDKIDVVYEKKGKIKSKKLKLKQLLKRLSHDVNIYFPIDEHRNNVLNNGENYWVAFNPPDHDSTEYFVRAFNPQGKDTLISSKKGIDKNLLIIAYSENQEYYSPDLMMATTQSIVDCPGNEPCLPDRPDPDPLPDPDPNPGETEEGINIAKIKTKNIDDGYFDGDLELKIQLVQSLAEFSSNLDGPFNLGAELELLVNPHYLFNQTVTHDAGHWYWDWYRFRFKNSNNWTFINYKRKWSDRQTFLDLDGFLGTSGLVIYNNIFRLKVIEEDPINNNQYFSEHYNFLTYPYGNIREFNADGGKFYMVIEKGQYPSNSY